MKDPGPTEKKRRRWKWLAAALLIPIIAIAAIPWGLATPPGQRWLLWRANRTLKPGSITWSSLRFSWFGPTRFTDLVLRDAQGDRVVHAPRATSDRTLGRLLFDQPRFGKFVLERAELDVERLPDGTIDLYETLKPIIRYDPRTDVTVVIEKGRLRFRGEGLSRPLTADRAELTLKVGPGPKPILVQLDLSRPEHVPRPDESSLAIRARIERWWEREGPSRDVTVSLAGRGWPMAVEGAGLEARGVLDGKVELSQRSGRWSSGGDVALASFEAAGPRLAGDRLRLDTVRGAWDVAQAAGNGNGPDSWVVRRLDASSPIFSIKTEGPLPAPTGSVGRIEGTLDLAGLSRQVPRTLRLREGIALDRGTARVRAEAKSVAGGADWKVEADVSDLAARDGDRAFTLESPANLSARLEARARAWTLRQLAVKTAFLDATGEGNLDDGITWMASLDLAGFRRQLSQLVDFGRLELAGKGDLSGEYRREGESFRAMVSGDLNDLLVGGLASGPLERDQVRLKADVRGTADANGLPRSWQRLSLGVYSGAVNAELVAAPEGRGHRGSLTVTSPFTTSGRAEVHVAARWDDDAATIDRARLAIAPEGPESQGEPIAVEAHGRFDRAKGELLLTPTRNAARAGAGPVALALAPDGVRVAGIGKAGGMRVDASLDGELAALGRLAASWGGTSPSGLGGRWSSHASWRELDDGWQVVGKVDVPELILPAGPPDRPVTRSGGPVVLSMKAGYQPGRDRLELVELALSSRYATVEASGVLGDLGGARRLELLGKMTPEWDAINRLLAERVEPGARVSGRPRPIRLAGSLRGEAPRDWLKSLDGEFGIDLLSTDIFGMKLGETPLVVRTREGRVRLDPIDTSLNRGRIHLEPELILDDPAGAWLKLGPESYVADAQINDEVSHRVLAFAAPVLDNATRARGRVSVRLQEAKFALGEENKRGTTVTGAVLFQDAEFLPGPIADQLFDLIGVVDRPTIKLNQPVGLTIADRRVHQRGLVIPVGQFTEITMEGWVDFDRNLAMNASVPITPTMLKDRPLFGDFFSGLRINVPIGGTLAKPEIDRDAFNVAMQDLGKTLLDRTVNRTIPNLIDLFTRPRDPNAPPPLTPQERRARRQERRMQP